MSVREDDRNKSSTGRGLGLAAAAIGVGVGAALYYLYNRATETPHREAANTSNDVDRQKALERAMRKARAEQEVTEKFRERTWSLEECTVCCDVMLRNQELEMLPCGHQFHACCIRPWLEERTTCPNCRKTA